MCVGVCIFLCECVCVRVFGGSREGGGGLVGELAGKAGTTPIVEPI